MAKKIIPASEVRKGDTIRNTFVVGDVTVRREGVVDFTGGTNGNDLRTVKDYSLGPSSGTIQLLSRPKTVRVLPTGEGAVVEYTKDGPTPQDKGPRLATLSRGRWNVTAKISANPDWHATDPGTVSPHWLTGMVNSDAVVDFKVHFAGVAK